MTLSIPIIPGLDYTPLAKAIKSAGTNPNHTLMTVAFRSDDDRALQFAMELDDYFGKHQRVIVENEVGSPTARSNRMFTAATTAFRDEKYPLLYFDPSQRPAAAHWLDVLQANYFRCAAPQVFAKFLTGKPFGSLILSMRYLQTSTLRNFLPPDTHWRAFLATEMLLKNEPAAEEIIGNVIASP